MDDVDERFSQAIAGLYGDAPQRDNQDEYDPTDPFWAAMERGIEEAKKKRQQQ
jgi:hypothetical protein